MECRYPMAEAYPAMSQSQACDPTPFPRLTWILDGLSHQLTTQVICPFSNWVIQLFSNGLYILNRKLGQLHHLEIFTLSIVLLFL